MNSFLDQFNLTPQERRIVVVIAAVVFVVLNGLLVWPHFKDLALVRKQLAETRKEILKQDKEILMDMDPSTNGYKKQLSQLQRQQGGGVMNQQVQLQRTVSDQAIRTGVDVHEIRPVTAADPDTNAFYEEQSVNISFESMEPQLVNFLFNVGNDPAMIRVRELHLRAADANRYRLRGDATLSAHYAKQTAKPVPTSPLNPKKAPGAQSAPKNL